MAQGSSTVPPPPTGDPNVDVQGVGNSGGMDRVRSFISHLSGGGTPAIDAALKKHHDAQVAEAQMHAGNAKTAAGMLFQARTTGLNPTTGKPVTPEDLQKWQQQYDASWGAYTKIAGKSKQAKPIIQQMGGLLSKITGHPGPQGAQGAGGGAGAAPSSPASPSASPSAAPTQQGSPTVPQPPQGAQSAPAQTVPPPPGAQGPLMQAGQNEAAAAMMKEQDAIRTKDEEYRNKLAADADPRYHTNEIKQFRSDLQEAFPDMSPDDLQKAVLTKAGVVSKGTGKEMQPDFKDGMLVGVKDSADNKYYTDPEKMPPDAKAIYDSAKKVEKEHEAQQEAKEQRREASQERLAALHERIHDREQELSQSSKIPIAVASRASQAEIIKEQTADLREMLKDPELQKNMGPIAGRTRGAVSRLYNKKVQDFFASQESLDALLPLLHGYRGGAQTHKTFKDAMGSLTIDPKAYAGTLDALDKMADNVVDEVKDEYPNAPMFKNKRDAAASTGRAKTVTAPPSGKTKRFTDGATTYNIPIGQVEEFKKAHPNAR